MQLAKRQQGAALVIAMLILSLVVVFAAGMTVQYDFSMRRMTNQMQMQQAYQYLLAVESFAEKGLREDLKQDEENDASVDKLSDLWSSYNGQQASLGDAMFRFSIYDLQGRFNLNSLSKTYTPAQGQSPPQIPYTIEQGIFIRLLVALGDDELPVSIAEATAITEAVIDWLDEDSEPTGFNGCEDDAYYGIDGRTPHRTANSAFLSVSELRLICNLPVALYERLLPWVTVWPVTGDNTINLNTVAYLQPLADEKDSFGDIINDSPMLRSILMDKQTAEGLKSQIDGKTFYNVPMPISYQDAKPVIEKLTAGGYDDFATLEADLGSLVYWPGAPLGLHSDYFLLETDVLVGDLVQSLSSVIHRDDKDGKISIIARSTGGL